MSELGPGNRAHCGVGNDAEIGREGAACPAVAEAFREQSLARVEGFYADLGRLGEVAPAARLRLEGFLEAGLALGLVTRDEVSRWVNDSYRRNMPPESGGHTPAVLADCDDGVVVLPVRWRRAPVYPS